MTSSSRKVSPASANIARHVAQPQKAFRKLPNKFCVDKLTTVDEVAEGRRQVIAVAVVVDVELF